MHIGRDGLELKRSSPEILINNLKVKIMKKMLVVLLFLMGSIHVGNAVNVEALLMIKYALMIKAIILISVEKKLEKF